MTDTDYLLRAIDVGNRKAKPYNFGAVVVRGGKIIGESESMVFETLDPSAHSEVLALRAACVEFGKYPLDGATMYSSHEPCVMCLSCAVWAGVTRIVYATPASEQDEFMYEFKDVSIEELAKHTTGEDISVERKEVESDQNEQESKSGTTKKVTFQLDKLVRDTYYEEMDAEKRQMLSRKLTGDELKRALIAKVREELDELESGDDEQPIDIGSAVLALAQLYGLSAEAYLAAVQAKDAKVGGFAGGWYIESITFDEDNKWVSYYRKDAKKYRESQQE